MLRRQLEQPDAEPPLALPEDATVEQAESELARDRARLAAERSALTNLERLAEEQTASRTDISRRLGTLDQELQAISEELLAAWAETKMTRDYEEVRNRPHPYEMSLYFDA